MNEKSLHQTGLVKLYTGNNRNFGSKTQRFNPANPKTFNKHDSEPRLSTSALHSSIYMIHLISVPLTSFFVFKIDSFCPVSPPKLYIHSISSTS
jgi:hypothetical protein